MDERLNPFQSPALDSRQTLRLRQQRRRTMRILLVVALTPCGLAILFSIKMFFAALNRWLFGS
jgi:hypothetical protein